MALPIVIAHHLIWTVYGWWLPNDPRGSWSRIVRVDALKGLGQLHFGRKRIQPASRDIRSFYEQAKVRLAHPLLELTSDAISSCAAGFASAIARHGYTCYACAILFDHVHLIIRKHKHTAEQMIANLQENSRFQLGAEGFRTSEHPTWCRGGWKVFLDDPDEVRRTIRYVEENPLAYRLPIQQYDFVTEYDNWPLHEGHCESSPFVMRLRAAGRYPRDHTR